MNQYAPVYAEPDVPEILWPEQRRAVPDRCSHCGGRLFDVDPPHGYVRVGEIRCFLCARTVCRLRSVPAPTPAVLTIRGVAGRQRCLSCGVSWVALSADECRRCAAGPRPVDGQVDRLLVILEDGELHPGPALCAALGGISYERFRALVKVAQRRGHGVRAVYGRGYWLEGAPLRRREEEP